MWTIALPAVVLLAVCYIGMHIMYFANMLSITDMTKTPQCRHHASPKTPVLCPRGRAVYTSRRVVLGYGQTPSPASNVLLYVVQ